MPLLLPGMAASASGTASASASASTSVKHLEAFWNVVVEGGLLSSPSHERKFLAFKLFQVCGCVLQGEGGYVPMCVCARVHVWEEYTISCMLVTLLSTPFSLLHSPPPGPHPCPGTLTL